MATAEILPAANRYEELVVHHWAMDEEAAQTLVGRFNDADYAIINTALKFFEQNPAAVEARDKYRQEITDIIHGRSNKKLIVIGPCSLDAETDYTEFFGQIKQLQEEHPDSVVALRLNGSKPRTGGGEKGDWRGLFSSVDDCERKALFIIYQQAFAQQIPILTEITEKDELGDLAPYLSGFWLGMRDMHSTALRGAASLIHLPVLVKNSNDNKPKSVKNAIEAMAHNTAKNQGSGVDLRIAGTAEPRSGLITGPLPVGEGNHTTAIIARGYEVDPRLPADERRRLAIKHIGSLCALAAQLNTIVLIDGSHGVPPMFDIPRSDGNRFPAVMRLILGAITNGEIENAERIKGFIGEVGPNEGLTDRNLKATPENMLLVSDIATGFESLDQAA